MKDNCILATDFSGSRKSQELWLERRDKKANICLALKEYLEVLEKQLNMETDNYNKYLIGLEIKKVKKDLKKYYEPSILEMIKFEKTNL